MWVPRSSAISARLVERLREAGYTNELLIATCSGGVATPEAIGRRSVATIGSGPTGGVVAAAAAARAAGMSDVVSVDMGGTSYDVCLIRNGHPNSKVTGTGITATASRFRWSISRRIGAGGGSIAHAVGGSLAVGPESAGSEPGPVCYGRGGTLPTVTDADVILGRLDPSSFWGGRLTLDEAAAREAVGALGKELEQMDGPDVEETAAAITAIIDAHLTDAIRRQLSLAGADPRRLDLVAFGGMGAVHATTQAAALGMKRVLIPRAAPGFSALGLLSADHVLDISRTYLTDWRKVDLDRLNFSQTNWTRSPVTNSGRLVFRTTG